MESGGARGVASLMVLSSVTLYVPLFSGVTSEISQFRKKPRAVREAELEIEDRAEGDVEEGVEETDGASCGDGGGCTGCGGCAGCGGCGGCSGSGSGVVVAVVSAEEEDQCNDGRKGIGFKFEKVNQ